MNRVILLLFLGLICLLSFELINVGEEFVIGICLLFLVVNCVGFMRNLLKNNQVKFFFLVYSYYYLVINCINIVRAEILELLDLFELFFEFVITWRDFFIFFRKNMFYLERYMVNTMMSQFLE
jgi:hypothetical protein